MKNILLNTFAFLALCSITGCSDFLEEKSDSRLATPVTLEDNQALMDRTFNTVLSNSISGQISADEIYITDADYGNLTYEFEKDYTPGNPVKCPAVMKMTGEAATGGSMYAIRFCIILNITK